MSRKGKKATKVYPEVSTHKTTEKLQIPGVYLVGKTEGQKKAIDLVVNNPATVLYGVPGSGKSYIAMALGLQGLLNGKYQRLVITRPYVEAGEHLGFLPGDFSMKIAPYMQPLVDIGTKLIGKTAITEFMEKGNIQVLPLAYMRGTTLDNAFICADECQNATVKQMHLLLTRLGDNSKLVVTGDTEQSDLFLRGEKNGLLDCINRLEGKVPEIAFHEMTEADCVRSPLVAKIDKLYRSQKK